MRRPASVTRLLIASLVLSAALPVALAARSRSADSQPFEISSELLRRDPAVSGALAQVESNRQDPALWRALGQALSNKGAFADAVRAFERATRVAPDDANAWSDLGAAYVRDGHASRGVGALRHALKVEPFHAMAYYNLGIAEQQLGNYDAAIDAFQSAIRIDPGLGDPKKNPGAVVNRDLPIAKLKEYLETTGAAPALYVPAAPGGDKAR